MIELSHTKLDVWKAGIELTTIIYDLTREFPQAELYGLTAQMRRAAISIPTNISEGVARSSVNEWKRFYEISRSSLVELDTQLEVARNLKYLEQVNLEELDEKLNHLFAMLSNLISITK